MERAQARRRSGPGRRAARGRASGPSGAARATSAKRRALARRRPEAASRSSAALAAAGTTSRSRKSAVAPSPSPSAAEGLGVEGLGQAIEAVGGPAGRVADRADGVEVHPALRHGGRHGPGGGPEPLGRPAEPGPGAVRRPARGARRTWSPEAAVTRPGAVEAAADVLPARQAEAQQDQRRRDADLDEAQGREDESTHGVHPDAGAGLADLDAPGPVANREPLACYLRNHGIAGVALVHRTTTKGGSGPPVNAPPHRPQARQRPITCRTNPKEEPTDGRDRTDPSAVRPAGRAGAA